MSKQEIVLAFGGGKRRALGNVWLITSTKGDFYLKLWRSKKVLHLSIHSPRGAWVDHRFHIKVVDSGSAKMVEKGDFFLSAITNEEPYIFKGQNIAPGVFKVARIRWTWDMQRLRYEKFAINIGYPELKDGRAGGIISKPVDTNCATDVDFFISYSEPYWPDKGKSLRDNARLGPLKNEAGMWLTAIVYHHSQVLYPAPPGLLPPRPSQGETPNQIMAGGPGPLGENDIYWFVECITSREVIKTSQ